MNASLNISKNPNCSGFNRGTVSLNWLVYSRGLEVWCLGIEHDQLCLDKTTTILTGHTFWNMYSIGTVHEHDQLCLDKNTTILTRHTFWNRYRTTLQYCGYMSVQMAAIIQSLILWMPDECIPLEFQSPILWMADESIALKLHNPILWTLLWF